MSDGPRKNVEGPLVPRNLTEIRPVHFGELMSIQRQRAMEDIYSDYYDSLRDEEEAEQQAWGAFAETQLVEGVR